ncbi:WEB family protein At5g55860 [Amborella trichopoda]|uniref:WEB family protein n=1 Tax=Amborella trichopoda TaxID=13333 RepID=U5DFM1_AMBTC|nr:WEB family protein At5g55860 [Amborella trichopoda]XP_020531211.1 WEB family protein At5g55860 [Amborella trichopoda]XP_020531212.1 WEB family protein At5g55860 [Amborella trichopoda]XP_020531214.1 WEB family protein At5g55860 [Amborella trichopoda]ERN19218.1 hypothetical protein AMTR_s00061p00194590 [Amborella trichopoda]|eukprot:XP_006857751.1 WEB family protein At5g55860 [Amborella trichopoda]
MGVKAHQNATDSPKAEVGEIDTRAPFESVKAAVSLFGEGAFSAEKPAQKRQKPPGFENIMAKETQLHMAQKELNRLKDHLRNAETVKAQALTELEKAKRTIDDLTQQLKSINSSKESALKAAEAAITQAERSEPSTPRTPTSPNASWQLELSQAREQYTIVMAELDSAKQDLRLMRQEIAASSDAKQAALLQASDALRTSEINSIRASELSREINNASESLMHVKQASEQARKEHDDLIAVKDEGAEISRLALEGIRRKIDDVHKTSGEKPAGNDYPAELAAMNAEIEKIHEEIKASKASEMDSLRFVTTELDGAKETLQKVADEEKSMEVAVEALKHELERTKKEHKELVERENELELIAARLNEELQRAKAELNAWTEREARAKGGCDELDSALKQLELETQEARAEAEASRLSAENLRNEADASKLALIEKEAQLQQALVDAEEAKRAEAAAHEEISAFSERASASRASTSEAMGAEIRLSKEEFESLGHKTEEAERLADMKVAAAEAQVEAVKASEKEALKRLEGVRKEIEEVGAAIKEATKRAEMAEAARRAVEGELKRRREAEAAQISATKPQIPANVGQFPAPQTQIPVTIPRVPVTESRIPAGGERTQWPEKWENDRKMERSASGLKKKKAMLPSLSGIFYRKKNPVEGGSPSYLPGEKAG